MREMEEARRCLAGTGACGAIEEKGNDGVWCVCGGSAVPADRGFPGLQREAAGKGGSEKDGTRARPNPYTRATEGLEERDPKQPKPKRKEEGMGGWAKKKKAQERGKTRKRLSRGQVRCGKSEEACGCVDKM